MVPAASGWPEISPHQLNLSKNQKEKRRMTESLR